LLFGEALEGQPLRNVELLFEAGIDAVALEGERIIAGFFAGVFQGENVAEIAVTVVGFGKSHGSAFAIRRGEPERP